ncbi:MAG: phospho-sugar mutase, partial [Bacteroidaceae bacterium]|nr:phospho-sugar mutase [Bacteroidaceae bacterium]
GFSLNHTINVVKPGKSGADEIKAMMEGFRQNPPRVLAGSHVVCTKDYAVLKAFDAEGNATALDFPATSNVLQWFTADGHKISVRPSGTEPKIKFYLEIMGQMTTAAEHDAAKAEALSKVQIIKQELGLND